MLELLDELRDFGLGVDLLVRREAGRVRDGEQETEGEGVGRIVVRRLHRDVARERHARVHGDAPIVARNREPQALPSNRMRSRLVVVEHETQANALAAAEAGLVQRAEHRRVGELAAERLPVLFGIGGIERIDVERRFTNPEAGAVDAHLDVVDRRFPVAAGLRPSNSQFDVLEISHRRFSPMYVVSAFPSEDLTASRRTVAVRLKPDAPDQKSKSGRGTRCRA